MPVEPNSMLGKPEDGKKILQETLVKRITFGAAVVGFMKTLISTSCIIFLFFSLYICQQENFDLFKLYCSSGNSLHLHFKKIFVTTNMHQDTLRCEVRLCISQISLMIIYMKVRAFLELDKI